MRPHRCLWIFTHTPHIHKSVLRTQRKSEVRIRIHPNSQHFFFLSPLNQSTMTQPIKPVTTPTPQTAFLFLLILFLILFSLFEGVHPSPYIKRDHRSVQEDYSRIQPRARLYWCIGRCPSCWCCCRCCINFAFSISVCEDPRSNSPCPKVFY